MKKVCLVLVTLVILCGFFIATAEAGQLCWQVDSTNNNLDGYVSVMASGGKWTRAVHGVYYVQGGIYLPVAGNMVKYPNGSVLGIQLSTTAGMLTYLGILVTLDSNTLSGTGAVSEIESNNTRLFNVTFTKISCKELPPYNAP
jgi:hypothetical protein